MPAVDMPLPDLTTYRATTLCPADFDAFWESTLRELRQEPLNATFHLVKAFPGAWVRVYDLEFSGFAGHGVRGWYLRPEFAGTGRLPVVVVFHGYSGGRSLPAAYAPWLLLGCAVLTMDTRGQGGASGNPLGYGNPAVAGWMTQGLADAASYYYRAVFADALRLLEVALSQDDLDPEQVAVTGMSQGGGITVAAAALEPKVALAMPDVPFLSHYERAVAVAGRGPYLEIVDYLRRYPGEAERTFRTLSYFDAVNFAPRIAAKSLWSVALWDDICPPSTVYAAYNGCGGKGEMAVYPYNNHEGGGLLHQAKQLELVAATFGLALPPGRKL